MKIFLIGLPGSGKTTLGKLLAEKMNLPFVDLDEEIGKSEGQTIKQIFEEKKETYFRDVESGLLKKFGNSTTSFVMATGGGAPCFNNNMAVMNQSGKTVFLDVAAKEIASRLIKTNLKERPLLSGLDQHELEVKIETLHSQRINFYRQAHLTFSGNTIDVEEVILKIKG